MRYASSACDKNYLHYVQLCIIKNDLKDQIRMEMNSSSLNKTARLAGLLYLIWIITGLYAMFYIPSQINTRGDAVTTAQNILSHEFLFRTSVVNDLISCTI